MTPEIEDAAGSRSTLRARVGHRRRRRAQRRAPGAGLAFDGMTWPERFVATNVRYDFGALATAGELPHRPRPRRRHRAHRQRRPLALHVLRGPVAAGGDDPGAVAAYFRTILPPDADMPDVVQWSPYRMHQRAAERMRDGRVLLAGDAAHATNPTGGLGLTSGMLDTFVLYDALAAVIGGAVGDEVLDRYSEERLRVFTEIASPQASEWKRLVFHSDDPGAPGGRPRDAADGRLRPGRPPRGVPQHAGADDALTCRLTPSPGRGPPRRSGG